ncbi:MAG: hypothetical protein WKG07_41240 [Hymenobacter sp.]
MEVTEDLLAAARALLGHTPGFAAILGTGTNSCIYNGQKIAHNVDSLGYFLGDEGSGSLLGKRLLRDYMRNLLPDGLQEALQEEYQLGHRNDIIDRLYNQPLPNRFLASFAKFAYDHNNVSLLPPDRGGSLRGFLPKHRGALPCTIKIIPSTASVRWAIISAMPLTQVANGHGMQVGKIIRSPIDDLVSFHEAGR